MIRCLIMGMDVGFVGILVCFTILSMNYALNIIMKYIIY